MSTTTIGPGKFIVTPAQRALGYGEKLASDIDPAIFGALPVIDGQPVKASSPAFIYGHLALYPAKILELMSVDNNAAKAPAGWEELFSAGVECSNDPDGSKYPAKDEIVDHLVKSTKLVFEAVEAADAEDFGRETPIERYRQFMPTVGDVVNFMLNDHTMMHFGQVSFWRRCMGMGPAM
ncbi:MAG: hypothetical protein CMJ31_01880 [Phycisphaerae bacterium]|nr:hypothetical protein [Phycisphaerae bacterium]